MTDEFCKEFQQAQEGYLLSQNYRVNKRNRKFTLSNSEVITIPILFHLGQYKNLKHFYIGYVQKHMKREFPETVSYNRFVELQKKVFLPMSVFLQTNCLGKYTGISFIDSTPLRVCHIKQEKQHKVFKDIAAKG